MTSALNAHSFKKSGEFDRMRRELLAEFRKSVRRLGLIYFVS